MRDLSEIRSKFDWLDVVSGRTLLFLAPRISYHLYYCFFPHLIVKNKLIMEKELYAFLVYFPHRLGYAPSFIPRRRHVTENFGETRKC